MASLVLPQLRQGLFQPLFRGVPLSAWFSPLRIHIPSLLQTLFPPIVLAVPKSRTTHSAKRMRSAHKGLKEKQNLVHCPACGNPKLAHHLCPLCIKQIRTRRREDPVKAMEEHGSGSL